MGRRHDGGCSGRGAEVWVGDGVRGGFGFWPGGGVRGRVGLEAGCRGLW